ncbi:glycoside hydrolase [Flammeovirgaceae bacterium 311]|nr:glycoside hydrolase [Flammeovirgaceae bacterium 311]
MDLGWRFAFGHPYDTQKDFNTGTGYFSYLAKAGYGDGAAATSFDDRAWRELDLPHDWAVEAGFDPKASYSHGFKAIGRAFPESSVGWYRKTFRIPAEDLGRNIAIEFDGVYRNSEVWVNGHYLGLEPSGYSSFRYNITDYLNYGDDNVVAVRVDATMEEGWYYEGAGIYRHVWLSKTSPLHVADNGTFVTSEVAEGRAAVTARATITNDGKTEQNFSVTQAIVDATGKTVASRQGEAVKILPFQSIETKLLLEVTNPELWDLESPYLYKLITSVISGNTEVDHYETSFGIRTIRFDAREGFFLNGKHVKLKGTNNHQEHAGVGVAMPDELQEWRIKALKAMGSNAYRSAHNPATPELLDVCDRLGMLVIDENRLMGTTDYMLGELKKMIVRDRNHPSIISWSIGNEEWAIENSMVGARMATTMQDYAKSLDSTRAISAGISGGFRSGISDVIEVMGYNYMGNGDIEAHHDKFSDQPAMGTEEGSTFATRGIYVTDPEKNYIAAYDKKPRPTFYSIEEGWTFYANRPWLAGMFIWTGFDYRGEPTPHGWPSITSYFGMMDLCGFPKDNVYYLRSWWSDKPTLHLLPHWNWPGKEGQEIDVWAYSNCDEVELFLNKKSLGKKTMPKYSHLEWKVSYAPGTLEAVGYKAGKKVMNEVVKTTGSPALIQLTPHKQSILANHEDISVVTVAVNDKNNLFVPTAGNEITFSIEGPGKIIGVGNGDPTSHEPDKYLEQIQVVSIGAMKEKQLASPNERAEVATEYDDAAWDTAFQASNEAAREQAGAFIFRGSIELPEDFRNAAIHWFYDSIATDQSLYINGVLLQKNPTEEAIREGFKLDHAILKPGRNVVAIVGNPLKKKHQWDQVNQNPGVLQLIYPAPAWKRKAFNGLAQVIIQSTGEPGDIILKASSNGLKPGLLKIRAAGQSKK